MAKQKKTSDRVQDFSDFLTGKGGLEAGRLDLLCKNMKTQAGLKSRVAESMTAHFNGESKVHFVSQEQWERSTLPSDVEIVLAVMERPEFEPIKKRFELVQEVMDHLSEIVPENEELTQAIRNDMSQALIKVADGQPAKNTKLKFSPETAELLVCDSQVQDVFARLKNVPKIDPITVASFAQAAHDAARDKRKAIELFEPPLEERIKEDMEREKVQPFEMPIEKHPETKPEPGM